jgi:hypothetical protein
MPRARLALLASLALMVSLAYTPRARYLTWLNVPSGRDGAKSDTALSAFLCPEDFARTFECLQRRTAKQEQAPKAFRLRTLSTQSGRRLIRRHHGPQGR